MNEQMNVLIITDKDTLSKYLDYYLIAFPFLESNISIFLLQVDINVLNNSYRTLLVNFLKMFLLENYFT